MSNRVKKSRQGMSAFRYEDNPMEKAFALAWSAFEAVHTPRIPNTLDFLMDPENRGYPDPPITKREQLLANTLIQWPGSPVGGSWLAEVLSRPEFKDWRKGLPKGDHDE